ncbi:cob(I)yrinic acid a,c-diamide adenosyltransferase [Candidatus Parcubacteria bacterium]|nr:cob(I)yrinic acid a,c-diamide adenosyltransferase [Candidatus Parcubacteria bacterium]
MFYTGKGDNGTTTTFGCDQRLSKSSAIAEALGSLDETNSILGVLRAHPRLPGVEVCDVNLKDILLGIQQDLFIIQAELAGADKKTKEESVKKLENYVNFCEEQMPQIQTFLIPGADEISAYFDLARTVSRRTERRVVAVSDEGSLKLSDHTLAYLNRLSSALYAFVRYINFLYGAEEIAPKY